MNTTSSKSKPVLKALLLLMGTLFGLTGMMNGTAQSMVGKWQRTASHLFVKDQASGQQKPISAQIQQQYDQATAANGYQEILEFKPDHTYTSTVSATGMPPRSTRQAMRFREII